MTNHKLNFATNKKVECLNCKCQFFPPDYIVDIWDKLYCYKCTAKQTEEILQTQIVTQAQYAKAPGRHQRKQSYKKLSTTF